MEQTPGLQKAEKTILVVDDDATILKFVSELLVEYKYNVLTASSGKEALEQSRDCKGEIHLLLSDFEMPGMNGIGLATAISARTTANQGVAHVRVHRRNARTE